MWQKTQRCGCILFRENYHFLSHWDAHAKSHHLISIFLLPTTSKLGKYWLKDIITKTIGKSQNLPLRVVKLKQPTAAVVELCRIKALTLWNDISGSTIWSALACWFTFLVVHTHLISPTVPRKAAAVTWNWTRRMVKLKLLWQKFIPWPLHSSKSSNRH